MLTAARSGAIASIAFGEKVPAVDGNVQRVLSRVFAIHAPPAAKATQNALFALADELVPADRPGDFNQVRLIVPQVRCGLRTMKAAIGFEPCLLR